MSLSSQLLTLTQNIILAAAEYKEHVVGKSFLYECQRWNT